MDVVKTENAGGGGVAGGNDGGASGPMGGGNGGPNNNPSGGNKQFGNNKRGNAGGRGARGGQNRFGAGGQRGPGGNQNSRFNNRQNQQEIMTDNPGDKTLGADDPNLPQPNNNPNNQQNNQQHNQQQQQHHHNNQQQQHNNHQNNSHRKGQNMRHHRNGGGGGGEEYLIAQKLSQLQGPTHEIPSIKYEEIKFSGRNRLYVGNLTSDATEEELKDLFKQYGEVAEIFLNAEKFFAFIKVDFRSNAEKAKRDLDGFVRNGRALRVRFAPNATTVRVKNLTQHVSNELLHRAFEIFGQVERAVIVVDDRGKSTGEGVVEFSRKSGAVAAIRYCTEKCYFLTSSLRPAVCDLFEHSDDTDGLPEKTLNKKNQDFFNNRQIGPRFADFNSFEHEYGTRWKQLLELYKKKHEALDTEMRMEEEKLEAQMEYARYEHETELLRNQLRMREQDRDQVKSNWEMKEKYADEQRLKSEEAMRRTQEEMAARMGKQEEELRRRQQENTLFMQAQHLNQMIEPQNMNQGPVPPNMGGGVDLGALGGGNVNMNNMIPQQMLPGGGGGMGGISVEDMDINGMIGGGNVVGQLGGGGGMEQMLGGGGGGPMGGGPPPQQMQQQQQQQQQNRNNKNFNNGPNNRNFGGGFNNQMGIQDDGGFINNFGNNSGGGNGGGGNNRGNNNRGSGGGRQWNNNHNNQMQQNMNDGGGNNFQNKRRRF